MCYSPAAYTQEIAFEHKNKIEHIFSGHQGGVFLSTEDEVAAFDGSKLRFPSPGFDQKITHAIVLSPFHKMIATDTSVYITYKQKITDTINLPASITALSGDEQQLFIGTAGAGLFHYALTTDQLTRIESIADIFINDLSILNKRLWVALDNGITSLSIDHLEKLAHYDFEENIIAHLQAIDQDQLLVFSQFGQIYQLSDEGKLIKTSQKQSAEILKVSSKLGATFVLTKKACFQLDKKLGLTLFSKGAYTDVLVHDNLLFLSQENELIQFDITQNIFKKSTQNYALFEDENELLWTGGNGQIQCFKQDSLCLSIALPSHSSTIRVTALFVSSTEIYVGTLGDGLYVFDKLGHLTGHFMVDGDENKKNIIQIKATDDLIWVAYLNGIITIDPVTKKIQSDFESLIGNNYLYCFYPIDASEVYAGTSARGIIHIKDGKSDALLKKTSIYSLTKQGKQLIIATEDAGLHQIDLNTKAVSSIQNTADFNEILNVVPVGKQLLIGTANALFLYDKETKERNNLPGLFNGEMQLNASSFSNKNIYIGYEEGVLCLNQPRLLKLSTLRLHLQTPKLFEQPVADQQTHFKYNENTFSFNYYSNNYYQAGNTLYQYRMLGMDSLWQASNQTVANYYKMPAGQYTFELTSGVYPGFLPNNVVRYSFTINPPFWERWWFILLSIALVALAVYYIVQRREARLLAKEQLKQSELKFQLQQLKRQVNPHFLFNSLNSLIGLIEDDAPAAAKAAEEISNLYRNILQYQNIDRISLAEELQLAQQYFNIHQLRYFDLIHLEVDAFTIHKNQYIVPLSCQFLIENAIKHNTISKNNKLNIKIAFDNDYLVVSNNKTEQPKNVPSTKTGLANLNKRYQHLANQAIEIIEDEQFFTVKLPLI